MFNILKSTFDVVGSVTRIVTAPIEVALDLTKAVVKPIADVAKDAVQEIKDVIEDDM